MKRAISDDKTETSCDSLTRVLPRLAPVTCICMSSDWFIVFLHLLRLVKAIYFGFGLKTLN